MESRQSCFIHCSTRWQSFTSGTVFCFRLAGKPLSCGRLASGGLCSFIKRVSEGSSWEDDVAENSRAMLAEVLEKLRQSDPVRGRWKVSSTKGKVWCDVSSLATGCALEVDGEIVEDGSWLRKEDTTHINLAELDSVLKGLNLAAMWNLDEVEIVTDSATVFGWLQSALYDTHMVRTRGLSEILVKRRLSLVRDVCKECGIRASVSWIQSSKNKADVLTRVSKKWLQMHKTSPELCCVAESQENVVRDIHTKHHLGVDRTLYLSRMKHPSLSRDLVSKVVSTCVPCCSIDPAPVRWEKGGLDVKEDWSRVAVDVTHYKGNCYLSLIDCGPSRFALWRRIRDMSVESIKPELLQIFRERGPPKELLMDNGRTFRSAAVRELLLR